jgi:hypothetical protein
MHKRCLPNISFATIAFLITMAMMTLSSVAAHAQIHWTVLVIHGRFDPSSGCAPEQYGTFTFDQACAWGAGTPISGGTVKFVNWDAWNHSFDDATWPGGEAVVHSAVFGNCDTNTNHHCVIICHSAGCAATEHFIAVCVHANVLNAIHTVIAAGSAAGGSELASLSGSLLGQILSQIGFVKSAPLDQFLTTSYTRGAYNHNNMQGVPIRAIAGTGGRNGLEGDFEVFPDQGRDSNSNPQCQTTFFNSRSMCSDDAIALHSSCGHNRVASFQDCNSRLTPFNDTAGTYAFHGWWVDDNYKNSSHGPFSTNGRNSYNSRFHTYIHTHGDLKKLATDEYSACPAALCP